MHELANKLGKSIIRLTICHFFDHNCDFAKFLNLFPNVEQIIAGEGYFQLNETTSDHQLNLMNLESLSFERVDDKIMEIILLLPENSIEIFESETEEQFHRKKVSKELMSTFFKKQQNVRELKVGTLHDSSWFQNLRLKKLTLLSSELDSKSFKEILGNQPDLEFFDMRDFYAPNWVGNEQEDFKEVAKLKKLKVLKIDIRETLIPGMTKDLIELKELDLKYNWHDSQAVLKVMQGLKVEKLSVNPVQKSLSENDIVAMHLNFPNVKHLQVKSALLEPMSQKTILEIVKEIRNLETLVLISEFFYFSKNSSIDGKIISEKLRKIHLHGVKMHHKKFVEIVSGVAPNLEKLKLTSFLPVNHLSLLEILKQNKNLTHLCVSAGYSYTDWEYSKVIETKFDQKFVDVLQEWGKNLEFFEMLNLEVEIDQEILEKAMNNKFKVALDLQMKQVVMKSCEWEWDQDEA